MWRRKVGQVGEMVGGRESVKWWRENRDRDGDTVGKTKEVGEGDRETSRQTER